MPALPPADGVTRAVLDFTYGGQKCANVMHFVTADGVDAPSPAELGSRLAGWWFLKWQGVVPTTLSMDKVILTDLSADAAPSIEYTTGLPAVGTNAGAQMPNNVTLCISLRTALRGRSYRGRIYHLGLREDIVTGNTVSAATAADHLDRYDDLMNLTSGSGEPAHKICVLSYWANGTLRSTPVATIVTSMSVNAQVDTMRRRMP